MNISIKVPEEFEELVVEMLRKASGKVVTLDASEVGPSGSFEYSWKEDDESDKDFMSRAVISILIGIVEWGGRVKDTYRYEEELRASTAKVKPVNYNVPETIFSAKNIERNNGSR